MRFARTIATLMLVFFAGNLLAASFSVSAFADALDHDRAHLATHDEEATHGLAGPGPMDASHEHHHDACHGAHHLQAFDQPTPRIPVLRASEPRIALYLTRPACARAQLPFRPPRLS